MMKRMNQLFLFLILTCLQTLSAEDNYIIDTYVLWKSPSCADKLLSNHQFSPLWHYNNATYFVWVDADYRPWVTKLTHLATETVPLDDNDDFRVRQDPHYKFSLGFDKEGYLHITGAMHNYNPKSSEPYPDRYLGQTIMYWKSNLPEDIDGGFSFAGGLNSSTTIPGFGYTYGRFFVDNEGELYYNSRVKAIVYRHQRGEMGLGLYKYDVETKSWSALGGLAEDTREGDYRNVLLWENSGMAPDGWYQGLLTALKFDGSNRLHMATTMNRYFHDQGNDVLAYAYSIDKGMSWYRADGTPISHLPMRLFIGFSNQADIVTSTSEPPFYDSRTQVISDKMGNIGVFTQNDSCYFWKGKSWSKDNTSFAGTCTADVDNKSNLVLGISGVAKIYYTESFDSTPITYDFIGYNQYDAIDSASLLRNGVLYGVGIDTTDNTQSILKTTITPAPLPNGWESAHIQKGIPKYRGVSGYRDCRFYMNTYGTGLIGQWDAYDFMYTTLEGDGSITAKVAIQGPGTNSRAGVMMLSKLEPNALAVALSLVPNQSRACFSVRITDGDTRTGNWWLNGEGMEWVKLTRKGDMFTGFVSKDGDEWVQVWQRKLVVPSTLYVGLAGASYYDTRMQSTVFDSVRIEK